MANLQPSFPRKRESSERLVTTVNPGYISSVGCNTLLEPDKRKTLGEPPVCSKIKAAEPPSPKAAAHRPMVGGSRPKTYAVAEEVHP